MSLHPDILFHFTNKDALYAILQSTFKVSYARETVKGVKSERKFGVPMVSFCDLKLSELKEFIDSYGKFGIGLTKKWANKNGLNPVFYVSRHSNFADTLVDAMKVYFEYIRNLSDLDHVSALSTSYQSIMNTYRYIKNYEGDLIRTGKKIVKDYRYADEREWRYVPAIDRTDVEPFASIDSIDTTAKKKRFNEMVDHIRLDFEPDDIKYLIVEKDDDIVDLIRHLKSVKSRFDPDTISRLSSRILTVEQINNDI